MTRSAYGAVAAKEVSAAARMYTWYESPIGPLLLAGTPSHLTLVSFAQGKHARHVKPEWREDRSATFWSIPAPSVMKSASRRRPRQSG